MQCDLCPRDCRLHEGQRGLCFVRQRVGDAMVLTTYGRSRASASIRSRRSRSITSIPARASCRSAPRAAISRASSARTGTSRSRARWTGCWTRRRPRRSRRRRAAGCERRVHLQRSGDLRRVRDGHRRRVPRARGAARRGDRRLHARRRRAASSTRRWTRRTSISRRSPTSSTSSSAARGSRPCSTRCSISKHETEGWFEITTLLIPGQERLRRRDRGDVALDRRRARSRRAAALHGVPSRLQDERHPADAGRTLPRARTSPSTQGLHYVYTGNVHDETGGTTYCPGCATAADRARLVRKTRYRDTT